jgi:hypothetical protein
MDAATELWDHLRRVTIVNFTAQSQSATGWSGLGSGAVVVESPAPEFLVFKESGTWQPIRGRETRFTNVFRWTILGAKAIRLEHLRFGPENPVHLLDLSPHLDRTWVANGPHVCSEDCYSADLQLHENGLNVQWSITGPKKNELIRYAYRFEPLSSESR